jgi:arginyl-tRNA synthetase
MGDVVEELITTGIAKRSEDGSVGVSFPEGLKLPSNILQKKDGTHGYFASDLACIKYRLTNSWNPSTIIYCTDVRQALHFKQVFAVARMA